MIATVLAAVAVFITPTSSSAWVCSTLDANPTQAGVWQLVGEAFSRGYSGQQAGEFIATTVKGQCPEYIPLLIKWANANG